MKRVELLKEIRGTSNEELQGRLDRLRAELFQHKMKKATNQLKNTMQIRHTRKEIARVQTVLAEKVAE